MVGVLLDADQLPPHVALTDVVQERMQSGTIPRWFPSVPPPPPRPRRVSKSPVLPYSPVVGAGKRAVVVGAGLAGLAAAIELQNMGFRVTVLEGRDVCVATCMHAAARVQCFDHRCRSAWAVGAERSASTAPTWTWARLGSTGCALRSRVQLCVRACVTPSTYRA